MNYTALVAAVSLLILSGLTVAHLLQGEILLAGATVAAMTVTLLIAIQETPEE